MARFCAAFVREEIPPFLSPEETLRLFKDQGAFISVSHPFDMRAGGWQEHDLLEILPQVDALRCITRAVCCRGLLAGPGVAEKHHMAGTVGSDADAAFEAGRSLMVLDQFTGPDEMRKVIRQAKFQVKWSPWWFHLTSRYASTVKKV